MGNMPTELEDALKTELGKVLSGTTPATWGSIGADLKPRIVNAIATAMAGRDRPTVASAIASALSDNMITPSDWRKVLAAWVASTDPADPIVQDIMTAVSDGPITKDEAVGIALKWAENQVAHNQVLHSLLDNIRTIGFNATAAKKTLDDYLSVAGLPAGVVTSIENAINSGTLTAQDILQIVAAWAAVSAPSDLQSALTLLSQNATPTLDQVVAAWLGSKTPTEVLAIFTAIRNGNWTGLLTSVLGLVNLGLSQTVLTNLATGKFREAAISELADILTKLKVDNATDFSQAIVNLVTSAQTLFADSSVPSDALLQSAGDISLWIEIRGVIYMTQLFIKGGSIVPTSPQAQPHVFEAASITMGTLLTQIVPSNSTTSTLESFCATLTAFLDVHFEGRIRSFASDNVSVLDVSEVSSGSTSHCRVIFADVAERIL